MTKREFEKRIEAAKDRADAISFWLSEWSFATYGNTDDLSHVAELLDNVVEFMAGSKWDEILARPVNRQELKSER